MPDIFVAAPEEKKAAAKNDEDTQKDLSVDKAGEDNNKPFLPILDRKVHLFSSFCLNPDDISFENQEENENILLFLRRSRFLNLRWVLIATFLLLVPFFILPFVNLGNIIHVLPIKYVVIFTLFYYLVIFTYMYINFITWYFNVVLITNLRIIDVDFSNLIYKNIATTKLSLVQDVSFQQVGVISTFFDFGDILIQTAGAVDNFLFETCPEPQKAVRIIEDLMGKA